MTAPKELAAEAHRLLTEAVNAAGGNPQAFRQVMEAHAAIDRLAAAPAEPPKPVGWQPIETAPKDGTHILCFTQGYEKVRVGWFYNGAWRWDGDYSGAHLKPPTHWQPLPTVTIDGPEAARGDGGEG